jgi:hypothetical protein
VLAASNIVGAADFYSFVKLMALADLSTRSEVRIHGPPVHAMSFTVNLRPAVQESIVGNSGTNCRATAL